MNRKIFIEIEGPISGGFSTIEQQYTQDTNGSFLKPRGTLRTTLSNLKGATVYVLEDGQRHEIGNLTQLMAEKQTLLG